MSDRLEGQNQSDAERRARQRWQDSTGWERLEEVGDLHYHASAFSSALDYYQRIIDLSPGRISPARRLEVLGKAIDAAINIGHLALAETYLQQAGDLLDRDAGFCPEDRSFQMAPLMRRRALLLSQRGDYEKSLRIAKHAFAILAITDEHVEVAFLQTIMGACHHRLGRLEKAEEFYSDALATFRRIGDELQMAGLYNNLALLQKNACQWQRALELMDRAIVLVKKHGASHLLSRLQLNLGIILTKTQRLGEARSALEKSMRLSRSLGDRARLVRCCISSGNLEIQAGRLARAEELILEGKVLAEQEGFQRESTIADEYLGDILLARGEAEKALFNYDIGLQKSRRIGRVNDLESELLRRRAEAQRQLGHIPEAIETAEAALAAAAECGEDFELGFCHRTLGYAHAAHEDWAACDRHFREAITIFRRQRLMREWNQSILAYLDARADSAGQAEFLRLRRYLLAAQEDGAAADSDHMLCRVLSGLAMVQMRLGQFDDALLTVYELERSASGLEDEDLACRVSELRGQIEHGLVGGIEQSESHLHAISGIPGLLRRQDSSVSRNLVSVLHAGMERVGADRGFIALETESQDEAFFSARENLSENLSEQLLRWYREHGMAAPTSGNCLFSRLDAGDSIIQAVPALIGQAASCVFMPVALHGHRFGVLFLAKSSARPANHPFDRAALDFLATYLGFLALFLSEKRKGVSEDGIEHIPTPIEGVSSFENIITQNEQMLDVLRLIQKVAPSDLTVLFNGETGTGKGLLAYAIHALSRRKSRKFLAINCAAIPESLLESELFGHLKGSFTGAHDDKRGLLAEAEGGTVFLDEIGKMPVSMQGKILHFLDTKVIRPVGSAREKRVDVRIVCASKTDLHELAQKGNFLEDLYYRLLDFPLVVPPLRERRDDIPLLVHHFTDRFAQEIRVPALQCSRDFMHALLQHDWPGNIRELEKSLKRAIVLAQGERWLRTEHLPVALTTGGGSERSGTGVPPLRETLAAVESREIALVLRSTGGNKSEAARLLKISYPSLLKKIRLYGIQVG